MASGLAARLRARYRLRPVDDAPPPPPPPQPVPVALSMEDRTLLQQLVDGQIATAEAIDRLEAAETDRRELDAKRDAFDQTIAARIKAIEEREDRVKAIAGVVFLIGSGLGVVATILLTAIGDGILRAMGR